MTKKPYQKPVEVVSTGSDISGYFWEFILYPDEDIEHKETFDIYTKNLFANIRWIVHDKDKWREVRDDNGGLIHYDGEPKKPHVHLLWKTESKINLDKVSALARVPTTYIKKVNSLAVRSQYLLHRDVDSLFDPYKHKYNDYELDGALPLIPNKWDEDYLFTFWGSFIRNTSLSWGDVVFHIGSAGHFKWLNKYRNLLRDIYFSSHVDNQSVFGNPYTDKNKNKKELEKCTKELECLPLQVKTEESGLI